MKDIKIFSGDKELIYSNRILCYDDKNIVINLELDKDSKLTIKFIFIYDGGKIDANITSSTENETVFTLKNFNNPLGSGSTKPVQIAKYNDRKVYIMFGCKKPKNATPIFDISIFLDSESKGNE